MSLGPADKAELVDMIYEKYGLPAAAEALQLSLRVVMAEIENDEAFAARVEKAMADLTPLAEQELFRRAVHGTESYVVSQGRVVFVAGEDGVSRPLKEKKFSDTLLTKFLESRKREVFGPKVEVAHTHEGFIALPVMDARQLQEMLNAPGDEVEFIDAEYEVIPTLEPAPVADAEIEEDFPPPPDSDTWDIL